MKIIPFEELYYTDFFISESFSKFQNWFSRKNVFSCIGKPKPSHTFLWFKNCSGRITDKSGKVTEVAQNQLCYMAKGSQYTVEFINTAPDQADSVVIHFQMTDSKGEDIAPVLEPAVCVKNVDASTGIAIDMIAEEFKKNIVCIPETNAVIYKILANICKKRRKKTTDYKYSCIKDGIELLENDSDLSISDIARTCGVSECYFRRLFKEYSGESPMDFRQHHRIEKAKQLLVTDMLSVSEIATELHFADIYHFSKTFKSITGISPKQYVQEKNK